MSLATTRQGSVSLISEAFSPSKLPTTESLGVRGFSDLRRFERFFEGCGEKKAEKSPAFFMDV